MLVPVSSTGKVAEVELIKETEESGGKAVPQDIQVKGISVMENASSKAAASAVIEDEDKKILFSVSVAASGSITYFVPQPGGGGEDEYIIGKGKLVLQRTGECNVTVYTDQ